MNAIARLSLPRASIIIAMVDAGTPPCYPTRMSPADRAEAGAAMRHFMTRESCSIPEAGRIIGLPSKAAAYRCAHLAGIQSTPRPPPPPPAISDAAIIILRLDGRTRTEAAAALDVTLNRVDDAMGRATPDQRAAMALAYAHRRRADTAARQRLASPKATPLAAEMHSRRTGTPVSHAKRAAHPNSPHEFWRVDPRTQRVAAAPMTRAEEDRLIAAALAAGRVTQCPPAAAAAINQGLGFIDPASGRSPRTTPPCE
ncbi:MAG: hypothetical protein K2X46_14200 [Roseomonas sp.]|nr:hypothetical protein [Roseomonas sp.]